MESATAMEKAGKLKHHILILVENSSVPSDRRVWQESQALTRAGFRVTVICPMGLSRDRESEVVIDGVRILRFPLREATGGPVGYIREYGLALASMLRLTIKVRREGPIHIIQACNPPDLLFAVALAMRPTGSRFVFDHHDLTPELFDSRFPNSRRLLQRFTRFLERLTFATADGVISTNESYRQVAIERGKVPADRVVVVRNGPDLSRFTPQDPDPELRHGKRYLLAYLGLIGQQDRLDYLMRVLHILRKDFGCEDFYCIVMGSGGALDEVIALSKELKIDDVVGFPGFVDDVFIKRCLSTADVCLAPDPLNPFNNVSTMMKVAEYMAMARPIVSFDLVETRRTAQDAAVYVTPNDERAFAEEIYKLLNDPQRRQRMGEYGRRRAEQELSWAVSERKLVGFYQGFFKERSELSP